MAWGGRWQVKLAHDKTQAMVISHSQEYASQMLGKLKFGCNSIKILGVEVDSLLQFDHHLEKVAQNPSLKVILLH